MLAEDTRRRNLRAKLFHTGGLMQTLLNTLYLTVPGYLHLDNDTLRFEIERETKLRVPLHHIGAVVSFGDVLVSPQP